MFFDTKTGEVNKKILNNKREKKKDQLNRPELFLKFKQNLKYMKNLLGIVGSDDHCALICQADDSSSSSSSQVHSDPNDPSSKTLQHQIHYALVLCNLIGTPLEYKYIDFEPHHWAMNKTHVVLASKSYFFLWNYVTSLDRTNFNKQSFERLVFIDNPNASVQMKTEDSAIVAIGPSIQVWYYIETCPFRSRNFFSH